MNRHITEYLNARMALIGDPVTKLHAWRRKRQALRDLEFLDDRLLADIGLERSTIRPVVDGLIRQVPGGVPAANGNATSIAA